MISFSSSPPQAAADCAVVAVSPAEVEVELDVAVAVGVAAWVDRQSLANSWTTSWTPTCPRPKATWTLSWTPTWPRPTLTAWSDSLLLSSSFMDFGGESHLETLQKFTPELRITV